MRRDAGSLHRPPLAGILPRCDHLAAPGHTAGHPWPERNPVRHPRRSPAAGRSRRPDTAASQLADGTVVHSPRSTRSGSNTAACSTAPMAHPPDIPATRTAPDSWPQPSREGADGPTHRPPEAAATDCHVPQEPAVVGLGSTQPLRNGDAASAMVDAKAAALARSQHGRSTRRQLQAIGISPRTIHRRVTTGGWTALPGGVIDLGTHQASWEQDLTATLLAAGGDRGQAWASHQTAGQLHQLLDLDAPRRHHITVPRHRRPRVPTGLLHRVRSLPADERTLVAGFPATTVARTLLDLASSMTPARLEPVLWDACRRTDDLTLGVAQLLQRYPDRHGRPTLTSLLADLHPQVAAAESPLEVYGLLALRDPMLPDPVLQYRVRDRHGRIVARLDAAWPEHRTGLEFDGARYHGSPSQRARDARRRQQVRELGWALVVVSAKDLAGARLRAVKAELRRHLVVG